MKQKQNIENYSEVPQRYTSLFSLINRKIIIINKISNTPLFKYMGFVVSSAI